MSLKIAIQSMAEEFTHGVLRALREASLDELLAMSGTDNASSRSRPAASRPARAQRAPGGRLARRSPKQIAKMIDAIVGVLKKEKGGMRSEELQKILAVDKRALLRPLTEALGKKTIRKTGQKRATRYFAA